MTTVTETPLSDYDWTTAGFTWNSTTAGLKTWATATISNWAVDDAQALGFSETMVKDIGLARGEVVAFAEAIAKAIGMNTAEAFAFSEVYVDDVVFNLAPQETIAFTDAMSKSVSLNKGDTLAFAEAIAKDVGLHKGEALAIAEAFARVVAFNLSMPETIAFAESIAKDYGINKAEAFAILEELRKRPLAVLSDMLVTANEDMTLEEFAELLESGKAPGYEPFRPFLAGDYEYRRAIFKAVLRSTVGADRAQLKDLALTVDVPDLHQTGTVTISAGEASSGKTVTFPTPYHVTPDLQVSLKSASIVAIPRIEALTATSFTVKLVDTSGNGVAGTFTWASDGY